MAEEKENIAVVRSSGFLTRVDYRNYRYYRPGRTLVRRFGRAGPPPGRGGSSSVE